MKHIREDGIANVIGGGAIEGAGIDKPGKPGSGEPGVPSKKKKNPPVMTKDALKRSGLMGFKAFTKASKG